MSPEKNLIYNVEYLKELGSLGSLKNELGIPEKNLIYNVEYLKELGSLEFLGEKLHVLALFYQ